MGNDKALFCRPHSRARIRHKHSEQNPDSPRENLIGHKAYAAHLAAARKGRVIERLRVLMRAKDHSDGAAGAQARRELARRKTAGAVRGELKYLSANELAE
jgi:hypothetical protein